MLSTFPAARASLQTMASSLFVSASDPNNLQRLLDHALTAQLYVAWAGEGGEEPRLAWWRTELVSEFGGHDLFQRLAPSTWQWAALQGAREAARRVDAAARRRADAADRLVTLFRLGVEVDELVEQRLVDLKTTQAAPHQALPGLPDFRETAWNRGAFSRWLDDRAPVDSTTTLVGRRLAGAVPDSLSMCVDALLRALVPLADDYTAPHFVQPR